MAKTKIDFRTAVPTAYQKPLYATVGAGDLAVTAVREYVADVQKRFTDVQKDVETRVADVQKTVTGFDAASVRSAVESRVTELQAEARALPTKGQAVAKEYADNVVSTYGDLAKRGEAVVKGTRLPSTATVQVGENGAEVKVTTTNPSARKAATTRKPAAAKKAPAKKAPAKKAPARKTTAKKAPTAKKV